MEAGTLVWVQDTAHPDVWVSARILQAHPHTDAGQASAPTALASTSASTASCSKAAPTMAFRAVTVEMVETARTLDIELVAAANGECGNVLLQNPPADVDQSDLVALPHLHEASILYALRLRYARDAIYTRIGEILISINPFKRLPAQYTREVVDAYAPRCVLADTAGMPVGGTMTEAPHLYAIARAAYVDLVRNQRNQSILISGESGAGKTEATKIMMKYFAITCSTTAAPATSSTSTTTALTKTTTTSIETQVLQSNPILEAFGNARTVRNDNSSRFGKFIELQFDGTQHTIVGARIRTYLLEKIRVITQAVDERNFHIFYELLAVAASHSLVSANTSSMDAATTASLECVRAAAPTWNLLASVGAASGNQAALRFRILNQSGCFTRRDGVKDGAQFERTHRAMQQIGLRDDEIVAVLEIVAAVLHMGNITFSQRQNAAENVQEAFLSDEEGDTEDTESKHFAMSAKLLCVPRDQLEFALTKRRLRTATETLTVGMDVAQAELTRNALAMECYRLLFAWLVGKINSKIHHHYDGSNGGGVDCIGLLDIFGFEDMVVNSFEQLCINYANEALQHQFNEFVFSEEQRLYAQEGIVWDFVDFPSNVACLALFERKPIGLFSLTDGECLFPQGSDKALLAKFYAEFEKKTPPHPHFGAPASGWLRQTHFVVAHYAGRVSYAVDGFLAKNKDSFCDSAARLLATSSNPLTQSLASAVPARNDSSAGSGSRTTGSDAQVRGGVGKSSSSSLAAVSVGTQFKQQLGQLLDIIRATAPHYVRCIKPNDSNERDSFGCLRVVEQLRSGGVLEAVRVARAGFPVRMTHRQFLDRYQRVLLPVLAVSRALSPSEYHELPTAQMSACKSTTVDTNKSRNPLEVCLSRLQQVVVNGAHGVGLGRTRVFFRRLQYEQLEQFRVLAMRYASCMIQKTVRGYRARQQFQRLRVSVLHLQSRFRGGRARALVTWMREMSAATILQRNLRRWYFELRYTRFRRAILSCQTHFRRQQGARVSHKLREARSATKLVAWLRGVRQYKAYYRGKRAVLSLQCVLRCRIARRDLLARRAESRNVSKLQKDNLHLQSELAALREQVEVLRRQSSVTSAVNMPLLPMETNDKRIATAVSALEDERLSLVREPSNQSLELKLPSPIEEDADVDVDEDADTDDALTSKRSKRLGLRLDRFPTQEARFGDASRQTGSIAARTPNKRDFMRSAMSVRPPPKASRSTNSDLPRFHIAPPLASMSKADTLSASRNRGRRFSLDMGHSTNERQANGSREILDSEVKRLRDALKAAAQAENPEEEQEEVVKRFVTEQIESKFLEGAATASKSKIRGASGRRRISNGGSGVCVSVSRAKSKSKSDGRKGCRSVLPPTRSAQPDIGDNSPSATKDFALDLALELELPQECDNNSTSHDRHHSLPSDGDDGDDAEDERSVGRPLPRLPIVPPRTMENGSRRQPREMQWSKSIAGFDKPQPATPSKGVSLSGGGQPRTVTLAAMTPSMARIKLGMSGGPLSARPYRSRPRFFGDDVDSVDAMSLRSDSVGTAPFELDELDSLGLGSQLAPPGSVPRWCKDGVCKACQCKFTFLTRRHHCRSCGNSFCFEHSSRRMRLPELGYGDPERVCDDCFEWRAHEQQGLPQHSSVLWEQADSQLSHDDTHFEGEFEDEVHDEQEPERSDNSHHAKVSPFSLDLAMAPRNRVLA